MKTREGADEMTASQATKGKKTMARTKKELPKQPKVVELRIRLLHEAKPDKNGFWRFSPVLPIEGTCNMRIVAKTPEKAKGLLEGWLRNELTEDIVDDEDL